MKKKNINKNSAVAILSALFFMMICGCKKYVEVPAPITSISNENAFKDDFLASSVLTGIYAQMSNNFNSSGLSGTSYFTELSSDNLTTFTSDANQEYTQFYKNSLTPRYTNVYGTYWAGTYNLLFTINTAIEGMQSNSELTPSVRKRLLGEAYFLRAFCYFYLTNLYGDVPLILTTNYKVNASISRTSIAKVYDQIVADLNTAAQFLDNSYVSSNVTQNTTERLRPNLAAVNALQARVYLYLKDYKAAENAATQVINNKANYSLESLLNVFVKNSKETIWALQSVRLGYNTGEGAIYLLPKNLPDPNFPVYASNSLVQAFEPGDGRKDNWLGTTNWGGLTIYYPAKYKIPFIDGSNAVTEYSIVLRLSEQYLIRAEARNEQGNISGALMDINEIRARSRIGSTSSLPNPLPELNSSLTTDQIKLAIFKERRVELFTEWGHRWFDLKRQGVLDKVMKESEVTKGGDWQSFKSLYPIPSSDILLNPAISQNPGYTN